MVEYLLRSDPHFDHEEALRAWGAFDDELRNDPYGLFTVLREKGPVHRARLATGEEVWLVVGYPEARQALADPLLVKDPRGAQEPGSAVRANSRTGFSLDRHLLNLDPPDHTRLRRVLAPVFSPRSVWAMRPDVERICHEALDAVRTDVPADLVSEYAVPVAVGVICWLLGVPDADRGLLREWSTRLVTGTLPGNVPEYVRAATGLAGYLDRLVETRRGRRGEDLISMMLDAQESGSRLEDGELLPMAHLLLVAGHETSVNLIGNGVAAVLRYGIPASGLLADPARLRGFVEEVLRHESPVQHSTYRYASRELRIGGTVVPRGAAVLVLIASANRDGAHFPGADRFDVDRTGEHAHVAFGHGVHHCLGAPLARLEGDAAFRALLGRFPGLRLADPDAALQWRSGLLVRALTELPVVLGPEA